MRQTFLPWWGSKVGIRGAVAAAALLLAGGFALSFSLAPHAQTAAKPEAVESVRNVEITVRRLASFERGDTQKRRFGRLDFRGGLVLTSPVKGFGGLSGLVIEPDGRRFVAVSDEGAWLAAEIDYDGTAPSGIRNARMGPIRGVGGRGLDRKRDLDAESMTLAEGSLARGVLLIGFERNHRIGRFPVVDGVVQNPVGYLKIPPDSRRMRPNKGFEAVTVLQSGPYKGSVVAFSERYPDTPGQHTGWIWVRGEPQRITFPDIGEFEVTDAASLANGTLLILERRFRWTEGVKMRIRRFPAASVRPGAMPEGETLIEADLSFEIDNMEGLAVHRSASGETILTLISDNNFNTLLQRTILLQFALVDGTQPASHR